MKYHHTDGDLKATIKSIFPSAIDGDVLKLVYLSNGFRMMEGAKPLQVGDVCRAEARIISVMNANEGKIVKVKGHVYRDGKPVIEAVSAFLYRGRFIDYPNTSETTDYLVELVDDAAVDVVQSKEWFLWDDAPKPLLASTLLLFRIEWHVSFKDKISYCLSPTMQRRHRRSKTSRRMSFAGSTGPRGPGPG